MANMAAIAERLASDPTYAEKLRASRQPDVNKGQWADYAADNWVRPDELADESNSASREDHVPDHARMDQCRVVAQALAFRRAEASDAVEIHRLINRGYGGEQSGPDCPEGFRTQPLIDLDTVEAMVSDPDCHWILAEAPNGRGTVADGALLGCACFSVGTAAASASAEEKPPKSPSSSESSPTSTEGPKVARPGRAAAIRLLTALPAFHGLLVGRRLLVRVEKAIAAAAAADRDQHDPDHILCCVPALRQSIISWAARRGYSAIQTAAFPGEMATSFARPTQLTVLEKQLGSQVEESVSSSLGSSREFHRDDNDESTRLVD